MRKCVQLDIIYSEYEWCDVETLQTKQSKTKNLCVNILVRSRENENFYSKYFIFWRREEKIVELGTHLNELQMNFSNNKVSLYSQNDADNYLF